MSIPVIDVSALFAADSAPDPRSAAVRGIRAACETAGFFVVVGHPIPSSLIRDVLAATRRLFVATPVEDKVAIQMDRRTFRGYQRLGENHTQGRADQHEGLDLFREVVDPEGVDPALFATAKDASGMRDVVFGRNQWPKDASDFRSLAEEYIRRMLHVGETLMGAIADGLGLPVDHFRPLMDRSFWILRAIFYPHNSGGAQGCGEHTDYGFLTLLADDGPPGCLEAQLLGGAWVGVARPPEGLVCNLGDMLSRLTGGRYRATPHRVRSPCGADRVSVPFFFEPNFDALIRDPAAPTGRFYGEHLVAKLTTNFGPMPEAV